MFESFVEQLDVMDGNGCNLGGQYIFARKEPRPASVREQSLSSHLALVACRDGHGNRHLFNELMRTVYVAWFLQQDGYGEEPVNSFKTAEYAVEAALELGAHVG